MIILMKVEDASNSIVSFYDCSNNFSCTMAFAA